MPVSKEEYSKLVNREMARYKRGNTGGESVRDKAVRAANVAAGYGNSTALKYPTKLGGGGRSLSRDGDGDGARGGPLESTGGGKASKPGTKTRPPMAPNNKPGRLSDEYVKPGVSADPGGPPGRLSDEYGGRPGRGNLSNAPGRLSDEFEPTLVVNVPSPLSPWPLPAVPVGQVARGGPLPDPVPTGTPDRSRFAYDEGPPGSGADKLLQQLGIMDLLGGLRSSATQAGQAVAPWLQNQMFRGGQ